MKRILALVLALTMCLSLAACGSSDETTPTDTNQTDNTTTTSDETGDNTNRDDMTVILGAEFTRKSCRPLPTSTFVPISLTAWWPWIQMASWFRSWPPTGRPRRTACTTLSTCVRVLSSTTAMISPPTM